MVGRDSRHAGSESDRFEIMRTVEMEAWSESRLSQHDHIGPAYATSPEDARAISPDYGLDAKHGRVMIPFPASSRSSGSALHEIGTVSPFADGRAYQ